MNKKNRISKIEIINGFVFIYNETGNQLKISRNQRSMLQHYDYSSIDDHKEFQDNVRKNISNGRKLIADKFIFIKEGETIYESV